MNISSSIISVGVRITSTFIFLQKNEANSLEYSCLEQFKKDDSFMLYSDYTTELLGLKDTIITSLPFS